MVNIWDYANTRPRIRLVDVNKRVYVGDVYMVYDALESNDERDSLALELDSGEIVSFYPEDIVSIKVLEQRQKGSMKKN